jgi:hypothetical protein
MLLELRHYDDYVMLLNNKRSWRKLLHYNYCVIISKDECSYRKPLLLTNVLVFSISRFAKAVQT